MGTPERTDISESHTLPDLVGQHVVIVGAGYLGSVVARFLTAAGARVTAATRSGPVRLDVRHIGDGLRGADAIVYAVAPRDGDIATAFVDGPAAVCAASAAPLVLVSSTSVYVSDDGGWVDEASPCAGVLADTERRLFARPLTAVVRCGGIYGIGRSPVDWMRDAARRERLQQGVPDAWMNWVRVEDAASAVVAALAMRREGPFNVAHAPVRRADFYGCAAEIAGVPALRFSGSVGGLGKRVSCVRAATKLGWRPAYPDYRDGLSTSTTAVVE